MKINIIGTSASGKSTFGRKLAQAIDAPFIEMDVLFWGPNWRKSTDDEFFKKIESALSSPTWVLDGNYSRTTPIKWKEVDTVIWLDYSFTRTLYQSLSRAIKRACSKTELWPNTGNYETFGRMLSKDSIIWWCIKTYPKIRKRYIEIMNAPKYAHIKFVHLRNSTEADKYILSMSKGN